jgi:hypothetical protein
MVRMKSVTLSPAHDSSGLWVQPTTPSSTIPRGAMILAVFRFGEQSPRKNQRFLPTSGQLTRVLVEFPGRILFSPSAVPSSHLLPSNTLSRRLSMVRLYSNVVIIAEPYLFTVFPGYFGVDSGRYFGWISTLGPVSEGDINFIIGQKVSTGPHSPFWKTLLTISPASLKVPGTLRT